MSVLTTMSLVALGELLTICASRLPPLDNPEDTNTYLLMTLSCWDVSQVGESDRAGSRHAVPTP